MGTNKYVGGSQTSGTWLRLKTPILAMALFLTLVVSLPAPLPVLLLCLLGFSALLVYALLMVFGSSLPRHKRLAIGYLLASALAYFWAGVFGLRDSSELLAVLIFRNSLVFPVAALTHAIQTCAVTHPCQSRDLAYVWPESTRGLSEIVIGFALVAMGAAVAMLRKARIGYLFWMVFVVIAVTGSAWNIVGDFLAARGGGPRFDLSSVDYIYPVFWSSSYALAYWLACVDDRLQTT
jgi:hypothetical protein